MPDFNPIGQTNATNAMNADTVPGDFTENDFMEIEMQRAGILQQNLELQKDDIQRNNQQLQALQSALAAIDSQVPANSNNDTGGSVTMSEAAYQALANSPAGADLTGATTNPATGQVTVTWGQGGATKISAALKDTVSQYSNDSQMAMITLQGQLNNYNQQIEMITNSMQKFFETKDKVVGNIR